MITREDPFFIFMSGSHALLDKAILLCMSLNNITVTVNGEYISFVFSITMDYKICIIDLNSCIGILLFTSCSRLGSLLK